MLVLTRKLQERIFIGENITVTVIRLKGNSVRLGIEAPQDVRIIRGELPHFGKEEPRRLASPDDRKEKETERAQTRPAVGQPAGIPPLARRFDRSARAERPASPRIPLAASSITPS